MPSEPRRTLQGPILRVRTGCLTCRGRKKKCDEAKPRCRGCERNILDCRWPSGLATARQESSRSATRSNTPHGTERPATRSQRQPRVLAISSSPETLPQPSESTDATSASPNSELQATALTNTTNQDGDSAIPLLCKSPVAALLSLDFALFTPTTEDGSKSDEEAEPCVSRSFSPLWANTILGSQIPQRIGSLPSIYDNTAIELLGHYLSATTISMANGSTANNPFCVQLVPLAFSSDLILQLLLTQSAVHRASKSLKADDRASRKYYNRSLGIFQQKISQFLGGQSGDEALILGIGALILCFIEVSYQLILTPLSTIK